MAKIEQNVIDKMNEMAPLNWEKAGEIAEEFGLKQKAVVASAIRNGIDYVKKGRVSKTGDPVVSKADLVEEIAEKFSVEISSLDGLEKANKSALQVLASVEISD